MAFHPYPRVIPSVFNLSGFGPPRGLTPASACPWVAHPASRPRRATQIAVLKTRFRCGSLPSLTSPRIVTRWLILQKARRHTVKRCSDCSWARGFRRCFTPLSGCFSPFPHGTGSLSVAGECSALEGGPPCFARGFTCPALLWAGDPLPATFRVRGSHPVPPAFPGRSPRWLVCNSGRGMRTSVAPPNNTGAETPARLHARRFGLARFRSPLLPGSRLISLPRGT